MWIRAPWWSLPALALGALICSSAAARADVLPDPQRPAWDEHPAPQPEPPPEKEIAWLAAALMMGVGALALTDRARRLRMARAARAGEAS